MTILISLLEKMMIKDDNGKALCLLINKDYPN